MKNLTNRNLNTRLRASLLTLLISTIAVSTGFACNFIPAFVDTGVHGPYRIHTDTYIHAYDATTETFYDHGSFTETTKNVDSNLYTFIITETISGSPPNCNYDMTNYQATVGDHRHDYSVTGPNPSDWWETREWDFVDEDGYGWGWVGSCSWENSDNQSGTNCGPSTYLSQFSNYQQWDYELLEETPTRKREKWTFNSSDSGGGQWDTWSESKERSVLRIRELSDEVN